ncbi:MAG: hypothetical protein VX529_10990 [Pseudomonadota bacterium]|nr:hypothetical protein [Pseudomonadota bacterium]
MALSSYAELQASVADWLSLSNATTQIVDFIALAEADMNTTIRARQNTAYATVTFASTGLASLPEGYRSARTLRLSGSPGYDLESVSLDRMSELLAGAGAGGNPEAFAVDGDSFRCFPTPSADTDTICHYYRTIPALADDNTSNWVLAGYPQVYLFGALAHGFGWHDDTENERKYRTKFEDAMKRLNAEGREAYGDSATMLMEATTP